MTAVARKTLTLETEPSESRLSPAGRAMGLTTDDCAAIRRHAMRLESRGDWALALDAYRMASIVDPTQSANWFGLARCYRRVGDTHTAERVELCARVIQEKLS
jgi:hypothetical protein